MCAPSKTLWHTLKSCKWGYLFFHRKRLEPRVSPWQQHRRCHSVYVVMYIAGAEFEEHCLNISRVILNWMLCCFSGTTYDVITFLICIIQKCEYLQNEKRYAKKENVILLYSEKPFKQAAIIFYFIGTLRAVCCKDQLRSCNIEKTDFPKLCQNKGLG